MKGIGATDGPLERTNAGLHAVLRLLLHVLNERELRGCERGGDAGLVDEHDAEAGTNDCLWRQKVGQIPRGAQRCRSAARGRCGRTHSGRDSPVAAWRD